MKSTFNFRNALQSFFVIRNLEEKEEEEEKKNHSHFYSYILLLLLLHTSALNYCTAHDDNQKIKKTPFFLYIRQKSYICRVM
jgi:hypothetical protein